MIMLIRRPRELRKMQKADPTLINFITLDREERDFKETKGV